MINNSTISRNLSYVVSQYQICAKIFATNEMYFTTAEEIISINDEQYIQGIFDYSISQAGILENKSKDYIIINASKDIIESLQRFAINARIIIYFYSDGKYDIISNSNIVEIKIKSSNTAQLYFMSNISQLDAVIGSYFSKTCRAEFCDAKCKLDIRQYTHSYRVLLVNNNIFTIDNLDKPNNFFTSGYASFYKTINDADLSFKTKIILHDNSYITTLATPSFEINAYDGIYLTQPCQKTQEACKAFNNIINFQGEPFIS